MSDLLETTAVRVRTVRHADDRIALVLVAVAVALLPLLHPKGPNHLAPADLAIAAAVVFSLIWVAWTRARLLLPFCVPVAIMVVAGAAAAIGGIAPRLGAQAIIQDLFLLLWCGTVATVCRTPRAMALVLRTWAWSATGWALIVVGGRLSGHAAIAGVHRGMSGGRAQGTFDHPNMAGNYFAVSLLVVLAARSPKHPAARAACLLVIAGALFYTGSNAALLGVSLAAAVALFLYARERSDATAAIGVVMLAAVLMGGVGYVANKTLVSHVKQSSLVRYSVARSSRSGADRQVLFSEELNLVRTGPLRGRGPASTKLALGEGSSGTVKEAHDDFLATMAERGPLGVIGLALLAGAIATRAAGVLPSRLSPRFKTAVPSSIALVGAMVLFGVSSLVHEILHYRHLWALLGILAALHHFGRSSTNEAAEVAP